MKPPEFAVWMFRMLGAGAGDELVDVYPGSGAVSRAWALYASPDTAATRDASREASLELGGTRPTAIAGGVPSVAEASRAAAGEAGLFAGLGHLAPAVAEAGCSGLIPLVLSSTSVI